MTKVTIRTKPLSGKRQRLYLDFYPPIPHPVSGKLTRREYLKLHLLDKPKNDFDKKHNKETKSLAEGIRAKRQLEIQNGNYDFLCTDKKNADFVRYFRDLADKRTGSNSDNWYSALNYLESFTGGQMRFAQLNEQFCNEFKEYLLTTQSKRSSKQPLSQNSAHSYFNKLKAAYKDGYLQSDLNGRVEPIKQAETKRNYLTLEELHAVVKTDCYIPILKKAAIFSALTGLRFSDIQYLTWANVLKDGNKFSLYFKQKKTGKYELLPISEQAFNMLGEKKEPNERVFEGLEYSAYNNDKIQHWILKAGITKEITFHCFRHTYATLQLSLGTDIYTVSKMLGHRELKTTEIYTKIVDEKKQEAANKIKLNM